MLGRGLCVAAALLICCAGAAAQNFPSIDAQTGAAPPIVRPNEPIQQPAAPNFQTPGQNFQAPAQNFPAIDPQTGAAPRLVTPKKAKAPAENTSERAISSTAAPTAIGQEKTPASQDPRAAAAQHQSGLSEPQARGLLQQRGYNSVNTLQPQPNSIWVWQADALKNGRPVRLGIDYRGNVLELGATATPCTLPGRSPTTGGFGVGARLSEASRCSGR
jgi:hypothetical protein